MHSDLLVPLEFLTPGETAEVVEMHGDPNWTTRMAELGLQIGARLRILRSGSPCLILLGNTRLSLRCEWALQILVRPVPDLC